MSCYLSNFLKGIFSLNHDDRRKEAKNNSYNNDFTVSNTESLHNILKDLENDKPSYHYSKFYEKYF